MPDSDVLKKYFMKDPNRKLDRIKLKKELVNKVGFVAATSVAIIVIASLAFLMYTRSPEEREYIAVFSIASPFVWGIAVSFAWPIYILVIEIAANVCYMRRKKTGNYRIY